MLLKPARTASPDHPAQFLSEEAVVFGSVRTEETQAIAHGDVPEDSFVQMVQVAKSPAVADARHEAGVFIIQPEESAVGIGPLQQNVAGR